MRRSSTTGMLAGISCCHVTDSATCGDPRSTGRPSCDLSSVTIRNPGFYLVPRNLSKGPRDSNVASFTGVNLLSLPGANISRFGQCLASLGEVAEKSEELTTKSIDITVLSTANNNNVVRVGHSHPQGYATTERCGADAELTFMQVSTTSSPRRRTSLLFGMSCGILCEPVG
jgi:hypothetical protein